MMDCTFTQYMEAIDAELLRQHGIRSTDLADYDYRDAYDNETPPKDVAVDALDYDGMGL